MKARDIAERLGVDPFEVLLHFCKRDWEALGYESATTVKVAKGGDVIEVDVITPDHQVAAAKEAAKYLYPQRKSIDVKDERQSPFEKFLLMTDDERARLRERLRKRVEGDE